jgi:hypothetical protein
MAKDYVEIYKKLLAQQDQPAHGRVTAPYVHAGRNQQRLN